MSHSAYDMRQKLLELQNELLKDVEDKRYTAKTPAAAQAQPVIAQKAAEAQEPEDVMSMLKEIRSSQHKMMNLLVEILNRLK